MRAAPAFGLACALILGAGNAGTAASSGWRVDCIPDKYTAVTRCFAATFGGPEYTSKKNIPFQVYFLNRDGPLILAGYNTYPGRDALVRVDDTSPLPAAQARSLVERLKTGTTAYVTYHVWPRGPERMTVSLAGFAEAYELLLKKIAH